MKTTYLIKTTYLTVATLALLALAVPNSSRAAVQVQVEAKTDDELGRAGGCNGDGVLTGQDGNIPITGAIYCPDGYVAAGLTFEDGPISTIGGKQQNNPNRTGTWRPR